VSRPQEIKPRSGVGRVNIAYRCSGLKLAAKSLLVYLALRYSEDKKCAWVSVGDIAHSCSMSLTCVKENLKVLVEKGLIKRKLRDENVKKSRKTLILWDVVEARAQYYRPKLKVVPPATTPASVIAADAAIADTLDEQVEEVDDESRATEDKYARTDEIITLLQTHLGEHPTFNLPDWKHIMTGCVRSCITKAGSGDVCFGLLAQICTLPRYEDTRKSLSKSEKLGGYIQRSFPGWFEGWMETIDAGCESFVDGLCIDGKACLIRLPSELKWQAPLIKKWLTEEIGTYLLDIEESETGDDAVLEIVIAETYKAARLLSGHTDQEVRPDYLPDREELKVAEVAFYAINDERWAEELKNASNAEELFLDNFRKIRRDYETQRGDDNDSLELDLPEPAEEEYVA
jgi:hypothetical protein